ncbi:MAG TPA: sigma-54 dependent transcriptional regulator [Steroidobacteraceae bacterium]|nr:sigma-54 dependent transcriptional regulator [Steroidobacteraceae bacterium]
MDTDALDTTVTPLLAKGLLHEKGLGNVLGTSPAIRSMFELIQRGAPTEATVLLLGESGAGKELVAETIHQLSSRASGPLIAINCASIPTTLIEAELFGYEKGSFTGASRSHAGVFERSDRGTLFLDEITEMPLEMQTRLLRVLETGRFYRVGGTQEICTDFRVIAATNRDIPDALRDRKLREDVLYRLAVFPIRVPALRDRAADCELLADHFLAELNARGSTSKHFSENSRAVLCQHQWPGNVRELRNAVERAFIMADSELELAPTILPRLDSAQGDDPRQAVVLPMGSRLDEAERSLIEATLDHFDGNKRRAAEVLGCSLKTLYNKLNRYARDSSWVAQANS